MVGGPFACAQIVNCIPIRRSGTQSIMGWQNNADASGFVLRDRIIAVRHVPMRWAMDNQAGAKPPPSHSRKPPPPHSRLNPHPTLYLLMLLKVNRSDPRAHKCTGSVHQRLHTKSVIRLGDLLFQEVASHLKEAAVEGLVRRRAAYGFPPGARKWVFKKRLGGSLEQRLGSTDTVQIQ